MAPETVTLTSPDGGTEAEFVPEANMICHSLRHGGAEWLEQRLGLDAYVEQGKTMGIPLLHPWANRLAHPGYAVAGKEVSLPRGDPRIRLDGDRPIHGVMPGFLHWELVGAPERSSVKAKLSWTSPELLEVFPFTHELEVEAVVGDGQLTMETTLYATGSDPFRWRSDITRTCGFPGPAAPPGSMKLGAFRRLVLDDRMIPTGERRAGRPALSRSRRLELGRRVRRPHDSCPFRGRPPATRRSRSSSCADTRLLRCSRRRAPTTSASSR